MQDDDEKATAMLAVRVPPSLVEKLDAWVAECNRSMRAPVIGWVPNLSKAAAVKLLIERGIEAMAQDRASAERALREAADAGETLDAPDDEGVLPALAKRGGANGVGRTKRKGARR